MQRTLTQIFTLYAALLLPIISSLSANYSIVHNFGSLTHVHGFNPQAPLVQGPDGALYGTTSRGEGTVGGVIFKILTNGTGFTVLKLFTNSAEGVKPRGSMAISGTTLYGATQLGGSGNAGTVFRINTDGSGFTNLHSFSNSDGGEPREGVVLSGNTLYGATYNGGTNGGGTVFRIDTDGTGFTTLKHFRGSFPSLDGANPAGRLLVSGSTIYGTTELGGANDFFPRGFGTVFRINTDGTGFAKLHDFGNDDAYPSTGLTLSSGTLYGTSGGTSIGFSTVTVFKIGVNGTGYTVLTRINGLDSLSSDLMLLGNVLYGTTRSSGLSSVGSVFRVGTNGAGFTTVHNFENFTPSNGARPAAGVLAVGGILYGTTEFGGSGAAEGTVFKLNTNGSAFSVIKSFAYSASRNPRAGVTLSGSALYGTTGYGTNYVGGNVYKVNTDGTGYTVLKDFAATSLAGPAGDLLLSGNTLYGTVGGNSGAVFKVETNGGNYSELKLFSPVQQYDPITGAYTNADGATPSGELVLSGNTLYGTTSGGSHAGNGNVFKVNTDGTEFSIVRNFSPGALNQNFVFTNAGGASPRAGLLLSGSTLYGTTYYGGTAGKGTIFKIDLDGGGFTTLLNFNGANGQHSSAGLVLVGATLYGTTEGGGNSNLGTVFRINVKGSDFARLHSFSGTDGASPSAKLVLSGTALYGATSSGGITNQVSASGFGTLFKINLDGNGFTNLHKFNGTGGSYAQSSLVADGQTLFGTASSGGELGNGVVFAFNLSHAAIPLGYEWRGDALVLSWNNPVFGLQAATDVTGVYTSIVGATSPHTNSATGSHRFFRLKAD